MDNTDEWMGLGSVGDTDMVLGVFAFGLMRYKVQGVYALIEVPRQNADF
jgi:hypothetical protein